MESHRPCKNCNKKRLIRDELGILVCEACGVEQEFDNFRSQINFPDGPQGTFVRVGSSSHKDDFNAKENKIYHAHLKIEEITLRLGFSSARTTEVKQMVKDITEGAFGDGNWFPVFIGACCYVVLRKNNLPTSMVEVAAGIGCELHELGRMVVRVVNHCSLDLPEFDFVSSFDWRIQSCPSLSEVSREKKNMMVKQGRLLLNCSIKWFLTTGRQPIPMVVAVLVFVAELNQVEVSIEKVAAELHAGVVTSRKRYKELKETLVNVAQALPWGKNVTVKNIVKNAPFVIQYMEMKSRLKAGEKRKFCETGEFNLDEMVNGCLEKEARYDMDDYNTENDSQYFDRESGNGIAATASFDDSGNAKISQECLSNIYTNFSSDNDFVKSVDEGGKDYRTKKKKYFSLQRCMNGESDLSKKLFLEEILQKNVGFNNLPPSFVAGELACKRRREKINAAKQRIDEIMRPPSSRTGEKKDMTSLKCSQGRKKGKWKAKIANVDWEDYIIETLLLHQVKEEEIEQGHYKRMLDLYVFDSEKTCKIFGKVK